MNKKIKIITLIISSIVFLTQISAVFAAEKAIITFEVDTVPIIGQEEIKSKTRKVTSNEIFGGPYFMTGDISGEIIDHYSETITRFLVPYDEVVNYFSEIKFVSHLRVYTIMAEYNGKIGVIKLIIDYRVESWGLTEPGVSPIIKGNWRISGQVYRNI